MTRAGSVSPDGKRIANAPRGNINKILAVFDVTEGKPDVTAGLFGHNVTGMALTRGGNILGWSEPDRYHYVNPNQSADRH